MAHDLVACLKRLSAGSDDHVFMPSVDAELLLATAALLEGEDRGAAFHLRLMYDDLGSHVTDPTWRSALKVLLRAPRARERVQLLAETSAFAHAVHEITGSDVAVLPHPSPLTATPAPATTEDFIYYLAGEVRADKGAHLISEILQVLSARSAPGHRRWRLRIHGHGIASSAGAQIERLAAHASELEYATNWQQAHAALLLHDPTVYRLRGSGVVCDAVASARPFVCLKGSSLAEWGAHGNAIIAEPDSLAIAEAMCRLMNDYNRYAAASARGAAVFPAVLRAGLKAFLA
jgi:hypothetical protein